MSAVVAKKKNQLRSMDGGDQLSKKFIFSKLFPNSLVFFFFFDTVKITQQVKCFKCTL